MIYQIEVATRGYELYEVEAADKNEAYGKYDALPHPRNQQPECKDKGETDSEIERVHEKETP